MSRNCRKDKRQGLKNNNLQRLLDKILEKGATFSLHNTISFPSSQEDVEINSK